MSYHTTILVKDYGQIDDNAAHAYEHMFIERHRSLLAKTQPSLTREIHGTTFVMPLIAIKAAFTNDMAHSVFLQNLNKEESYTEQQFDTAIAQLECEDICKFRFDRETVWSAISHISSLPWIRYEDYGYTDFYASFKKPKKIMYYRTNRKAFKEITINMDLSSKYFGKTSEYGTLAMRLFTPLHNFLIDSLPEPYYCLFNKAAEYDEGRLHSDIVLRVPKHSKIVDIHKAVDTALAAFKSPALFQYIQQELRAFAASPIASHSWGIEYYFKYNGILLGGKGIEALLSQERIDFIIDHLKISYAESPASLRAFDQSA